MVLTLPFEEAMKVGDLVYPWAHHGDYTIAIYLEDIRVANNIISCKIFCAGQIIIIPKDMLSQVCAS